MEKTESDHMREEYAAWRKDHVQEYMEEHNLFSANEFCNSRKNVAHPSVSDLIQLFGPQWKVRTCQEVCARECASCGSFLGFSGVRTLVSYAE